MRLPDYRSPMRSKASMSRTRPPSPYMQRTPMVRTSNSIRDHVEALAKRDPIFARVVEKHGIPPPRNSERGVQTLLRTIVGQQVSVAAARSMWSKLEAAYGSPPDLM